MADAPQDPFEVFRRLWGPLGVPVPGMAMPTLDPKELDKRIQELKSVEMWLNMNLNVLRAAIQGLEMQKAGLQGVQDLQQAMQQAMQQMAAAQDKDKKP
jgi:exonuclease VII small subunit